MLAIIVAAAAVAGEELADSAAGLAVAEPDREAELAAGAGW